MNTIYKITSNSTIDFAAEELKKYIRMMMTDADDFSICFNPEADNGFRVGLMSDFGLDTSDADDITFDDIIYIDCNEHGGIIAGSNPCATLIAIYRYLRFCGCRWLFPGIDGEWIPDISVLPEVCYRKLADHRYRGQCNEGAEYQQNMIETIDFTPKIGMNTYMLEFDNPYCYYAPYYEHTYNPLRLSEPVSRQTVMRWKRQCEVEIQKRGLHFHDMGHGWTAEPFGLNSSAGWTASDDFEIPDETKEHLAMLDGERKVRKNAPLLSNVCMSNPKTRKIMANYIADYAAKHSNVDYLHIWLADESNGHCECEMCRKKITSDWYVILLNDIDKELTKRNLNTRLVFIAYLDTFFAPVTERLNNNNRFTMLYAPITRLYTETYEKSPDFSQVVPYERNNIRKPKGMSECLAYLHEWKNKMWSGDCFCYEYHFMDFQYWDVSNMHISKILYEDIKALKSHGLNGMIEDGSQRSYFPTGFEFYVYGETLFDSSVTFDELKKDYFSHAFGADWQKVTEYLEKLRDLMKYSYFHGLDSTDTSKGSFYNPDMAENGKLAQKLVEDFVSTIDANIIQEERASSVAWQILKLSTIHAHKLSRMVQYLSVGDVDNAKLELKELNREMSAREVYFERYYDHYLFMRSIRRFVGDPTIFDEEKMVYDNIDM